MTVLGGVFVRVVLELTILDYHKKKLMPVAQVIKQKKYYKMEKTNQCVLVSTKSNAISLSSSTIKFFLEEQVFRAETLQTLDCVYSNYSFATANNDNKFKAVSPDSKILKVKTK